MQHFSEVKTKEVVPGIVGHYVHGSGQTIGYIKIAKGAVLPEHSHPHEQITYIMQGEFEMTIGGEKYLFTPGCVHVIPSNTPHSALAITDCIAIDVFNPVREDYK
ncbi:MAG TPA: cupin domain-containing protein [Chitinophagaceae bacterium]|nr:cupin domain-containing protein [Chitinophagaceae bacterium]